MTTLRSIREQMKSDFEWTTKALSHQHEIMRDGFVALNGSVQTVRRALDELTNTVERQEKIMLEALSAQQHALHEHAERTDQRLSEILDVVEAEADARIALETRVSALEERQAD